VFLLLNLIII